ncbi:DUF4260 family protein [Microbacterium invictum]|uniref:DUF4260 family protein n=1 Tax=Microbacterium invictum TaxID=515415 RepID=A0ABZ0VA69_9MICO|nr:DUF4260 family protein [Microbacterium invictum]WQB70236.1 DUF4260 family protein [Microbacterium invictum]
MTVHAARVIAGHRIRPALLVAAGGALAATVAVAITGGGSAWWIAVGLIAPDILPLFAFRTPTEPGRMPRTMVPVYNATHALVGPILLAGLALVVGSADILLVAASWLTHILWDRAVGYELRGKDGAPRARRADRSPTREGAPPTREGALPTREGALLAREGALLAPGFANGCHTSPRRTVGEARGMREDGRIRPRVGPCEEDR